MLNRSAIGLVYLMLLAGSWATAASTGEHAKWFVVRDQQTGYCRAALLVKIAGYYPHGFAGIAGGPYDTEAQALDRQRALADQGVCQAA
jgi:hypothetical protein